MCGFIVLCNCSILFNASIKGAPELNYFLKECYTHKGCKLRQLCVCVCTDISDQTTCVLIILCVLITLTHSHSLARLFFVFSSFRLRRALHFFACDVAYTLPSLGNEHQRWLLLALAWMCYVCNMCMMMAMLYHRHRCRRRCRCRRRRFGRCVRCNIK